MEKTVAKKFGAKQTIGLIAAAVVLLLIPQILGTFMDPSFVMIVMCFMEIYIIAVSGLDILFGYSGQISLGHAAFYGLGAYISGILHNYFDIPVFFTMIIAAAVTSVIGALLAYPASKLVFHFLSLATVAFGEIVYILLSHSPTINGVSITGNYIGLFTDSISIFGLKLDTSVSFYYFGLVMVVIFLTVKQFIINSKVGRAFKAIRDNLHAANGMGINVRKYKVIAFAISAFFTAYAGAMFLHLGSYIHPDTFIQRQSVMFLTMLLFGGTASLFGPIIGSISVLLITESLRSFEQYQMFIYGILMLIVIVALPGGLLGGFRDLFAGLKRKSLKKEVSTDVGS